MEAHYGVIVVLDALGVSEFDLAKCREFIEKRDKIVEGLKKILSPKWEKQFKENLGQIILRPNISIFQDSIILWWPEQKEKALPFFFGASQYVAAIINVAIDERIFLRGAISVGEFIYDESPGSITIIGPAVSDAFYFHDIAVWIGVIQTPHFRDEYRLLLNAESEKNGKTFDEVDAFHQFLYVPCNIPLHADKKGNATLSKEHFYAVSWPQLTYQIETKGGDRIINILREEASHPENAKFKSYYENALVFAEWYKRTKYIPPE